MAAFQAAHAELEAEGVRVIAASVDARDDATGTAEKLQLDFAVGYGLVVESAAATLTAFYETRRSILHATGFVVRPDASIAVACYSTGPIGRLEVEDVLRAVRFYKQQA